MATLVLAPELYSKPPINATPGARVDARSITLTAAQEVTTNVFAMAVLPAGHRLVSLVLESDDLDTGSPAAAISVGILNTYYGAAAASASAPAAYSSGGKTDTGTTPAIVSGHEIITASTAPQAGGRVYPSIAFTTAIGVDYTKHRIICFVFSTAPTTAAAGTVTLIVGTDEA